MTGCENDNLELLGPREMMKIDLMESMSSSSHLFSGAELIISTESGLSVTDSMCKYERHNPH